MTRAVRLPPTRESLLRQAVVDAARLRGWRVYFSWSSLHSPAGFPDLVCVKGDRLVFLELKNVRRDLTEHQRDWLADLAHVERVEAYGPVRPGDWDWLMDEVLT